MKNRFCLLFAVVALLLSAGVPAQISLPGLGSPAVDKKGEATNAQLPGRPRILSQIAEAEQRRDEALRQREGLGGDAAVHAADLQHLLDRLVVVERDKLKRLTELEAARKPSSTSGAEGLSVVKDLSGPPPYSVLRVDALRDMLDRQTDKLSGMSTRLQSVEAEKQDMGAHRRRSAEAVRLAEDRLARTNSESEQSRHRRARELAALQQQVADAELVALTFAEEALKYQMTAQRRLIEDLQRVVDRVLPNQQLSESDMEAVRARGKLATDKLKTEIDNAFAAHNRRLAERDRLVRETGGRVQSEERTLQLRFLDEALEIDLGVLRGLSWLQLIAQQGGEAIEQRFQALEGPAKERRRALESLNKLKDSLTERKRIASEQRGALTFSIREQETRLAAALPNTAEYRYANQMLDLLQKRSQMFERVEAVISNFERQLARWQVDLGGSAQASLLGQLGSALQNAGRWLGTLWHYELFTVEDTVEADGSRVPVSYGVTVDKSVGAFLLFVLGYWLLSRVSRLAQKLLVRRFGVEEQLAQVVRRWLVILLAMVLIVFVLNLARIPLTVFAFMGGALAIGVGFGTQTIIKNLISGIIILFERKIRVGDIINIGGTTGHVVAVDLRATTISAFDGVEALVPNSNFLENPVVNWTYSNTSIRREIRIGVAYGSDTRLAASILAQCAREHAHVLAEPVPEVFFEDYGDSALLFVLVYWVRLGLQVGPRRVDSDLRHAIGDRFAEAGIGVPFPQRDIRLEVSGPLPVQVSHAAPATGAERSE